MKKILYTIYLFVCLFRSFLYTKMGFSLSFLQNSSVSEDFKVASKSYLIAKPLTFTWRIKTAPLQHLLTGEMYFVSYKKGPLSKINRATNMNLKTHSSIHSYRHVHALRWENDVPLLKCYWTFTCSSACYDILPECASFITSPEECRTSAFLTKYCRMSCSLCGKCFLFLFLFFFFTQLKYILDQLLLLKSCNCKKRSISRPFLKCVAAWALWWLF